MFENPRITIEDILDEKETAEHIGTDKTPYLYEIKSGGQRVRISNLQIDEALQHNPVLRFLRFYTFNLYHIQQRRIAVGNGEYGLMRLTRKYQDTIHIEHMDALIKKSAEIPIVFGGWLNIAETKRIRIGKNKAWVALWDGETLLLCEKAKAKDEDGEAIEAVIVYRCDPESLWSMQHIFAPIEAVEVALEKRCEILLQACPIYVDYLSKIKGISTRIGASLISFIVCVQRFRSPSALTTYAGLAPNPKLAKGETADFSPELKKTIFQPGAQKDDVEDLRATHQGPWEMG